MALLWEILQFVLRLSFGMSLAMMLTSSKVVTSGFFRVPPVGYYGAQRIWRVGDLDSWGRAHPDTTHKFANSCHRKRDC